jgi:hypothetical protein
VTSEIRSAKERRNARTPVRVIQNHDRDRRECERRRSGDALEACEIGGKNAAQGRALRVDQPS